MWSIYTYTTKTQPRRIRAILDGLQPIEQIQIYRESTEFYNFGEY